MACSMQLTHCLMSRIYLHRANKGSAGSVNLKTIAMILRFAFCFYLLVGANEQQRLAFFQYIGVGNGFVVISNTYFFGCHVKVRPSWQAGT